MTEKEVKAMFAEAIKEALTSEAMKSTVRAIVAESMVEETNKIKEEEIEKSASGGAVGFL